MTLYTELLLGFLLNCQFSRIYLNYNSGNQAVSEQGRQMAVLLLTALTDQQLTDLFTAAQAEMMRGESVADWVVGFKSKLQTQLVDVKCPSNGVFTNWK